MCPGGKMRVDKEEQYMKVFRHLDLNGDGKITASELRRCSLSEGDVRVTEADGMELGLEDFLAIVMVEEEEEVEEKGLREAFKMYEDEKVGDLITTRSLKRMLSRLGEKKSVGECEAMIGVFDLDGDGVLSFHEFKVMMS